MRCIKTPKLGLLLAAGLLAATAFAGSDSAGVPNFHQVNPQLYRGGQPTNEGFQNLAKLGVKTVINLRQPNDGALAEKNVVEAAGMRYINVPMLGMHTPSDDQVLKVLSVFNDPTAGPVFVHCRRGADRTGAVVACYRISHDGWDNHKALEEAKGFGMSWFEKSIQHYVKHFKAPASIAATPAASTPAAAALPEAAPVQSISQ